jgi:hypothetical protein
MGMVLAGVPHKAGGVAAAMKSLQQSAAGTVAQ